MKLGEEWGLCAAVLHWILSLGTGDGGLGTLGGFSLAVCKGECRGIAMPATLWVGEHVYSQGRALWRGGRSYTNERNQRTGKQQETEKLSGTHHGVRRKRNLGKVGEHGAKVGL